MERTVRKLLALTGIFIGAAVALTPLTTYADSYGDFIKDKTSANGSSTVYVNVDTVLSLDAANGGDTIEAFPDMVRTGQFNVQVRSAMPYTISLSADQTELADEDDTFFIPARSEITAGKVGWGIRKADQTEGYTAVQTTPQVFFDSTVSDNGTNTNVADESTWHAFEIGVAINSKIPQGTYITDVTVTAAVKE